jgi:hypothetical protein
MDLETQTVEDWTRWLQRFVCFFVVYVTTTFSDCIPSIDVNDELEKDLEGSGRVLILRYCPCICLERLRKTSNNLSHDDLYPVRDLKPGPTEYEEVVLATRPRRSVIKMQGIN